MTQAAPPVLAQTCILAAIALACLVGAGKPGTDESNPGFVFIGVFVCPLGLIAMLGESAP